MALSPPVGLAVTLVASLLKEDWTELMKLEIAEESVMELGTGTATVAEDSAGLAVLSPAAGVSLAGDGVTAEVVVATPA